MSAMASENPLVMAGKAMLTEVSSCAAAVPRPIMVTCHDLVWSRAVRERGGDIALLFSERGDELAMALEPLRLLRTDELHAEFDAFIANGPGRVPAFCAHRRRVDHQDNLVRLLSTKGANQARVRHRLILPQGLGLLPAPSF